MLDSIQPTWTLVKRVFCQKNNNQKQGTYSTVQKRDIKLLMHKMSAQIKMEEVKQ